MFQVLSKIHELLIVSSLSTIIFSAIRAQLLYGSGVPLGMLCSGFNFAEIRHLFSEEFIGSFRSSIPRRKLWPFGFLVVVAGLVAVTVGPASAILMAPRMQDWVAQKSSFYISGQFDDLFPSRVFGLGSTMNPLCLNSSGIGLSSCPSSGFPSLMAYAIRQQNIKNGGNFNPPDIAVTGQLGDHSIVIDSTTMQIPPSRILGNIRGLACQTSVLAPWIPAMMYQKLLYDDWLHVIDSFNWSPGHVSVSEYKYKNGQVLSTTTNNSVVRTACSPAQNLLSGEVTFKSTTPSLHSKVTWLPLPSSFGVTSVGMIFESPWFHDNTSRIVVGCSIDARWADGHVGGQPDELLYLGLNHIDESASSWGLSNMGLFEFFRPPKDGSWIPITFDDSWLAALTPLKEPSSPSAPNMTTFETILHSSALIDDSLMNANDPTALWNEIMVGASNRTLFLEWMTALLISDGLSRYGSDRALNSTGPQSEWSLMNYNKLPDFRSRIISGTDILETPKDPNYTKFRVEITIQGLSYYAHLISDYLSIAVLLIHIVLALGHIVYVLRTCQSSVSWSTITELVVLAYISRPVAAALDNVSAGIECMKAYRQVVIVRAANFAKSTGGEWESDHKQAELIILPDDGIKTDTMRAHNEPKTDDTISTVYPLMPSRSTSNLELTGSNQLSSSIMALSTSWNPRSGSDNFDVRRRLLNESDGQHRIELDEFYS
ncbi:hypothetical protein F5Y02DRAFT_423722 [Annulohypoxylon stygium]|nr:hypothetical protein F5Y02DRAFT_423722 [Annulohypoxylon stygium]